MEKFKKKYRIPSARLEGHDYGNNGAYFITICIQNREHYFGEIVNGKMQLSNIGEIIKNEWKKTSDIRNNVILGEWVIMPNHFHAIVIIKNNSIETHLKHTVETKLDKTVETHCNASLHKQNNASLHNKYNASLKNKQYKNQFGPQSNNLSAIIRGFKGATTKQIRKQFFGFAWQSRFHDRIIRNEKEFYSIQEYIIQNPLNWENDENFL